METEKPIPVRREWFEVSATTVARKATTPGTAPLPRDPTEESRECSASPESRAPAPVITAEPQGTSAETALRPRKRVEERPECSERTGMALLVHATTVGILDTSAETARRPRKRGEEAHERRERTEMPPPAHASTAEKPDISAETARSLGPTREGRMTGGATSATRQDTSLVTVPDLVRNNIRRFR